MLSDGDQMYAKRILKSIPDLRSLMLPIVLSDHDSRGFELLSYAAERTESGDAILPITLLVRAPSKALAPLPVAAVMATFARVGAAYDLDHLHPNG